MIEETKKTRLDRIEEKIEDLLKEKKESEKLKPKRKRFKLPFKARSALKQGTSRADKVAIMYLTQKYQVRFLAAKIISGNLIVVDNKVHVLNPKAIYRYRKLCFYIIREIDRLPVSNMDYNKVKERRDDTEADVPLIKAVLGAVQKPTMLPKKGAWIAGLIILGVTVILFMFLR